ADRDAKHFYEYHGRGAVEQLYRVAAGLDSLMLGETQILQQIQDGFDASLRAGSLGVVGERLIASAIRAGRRARAETAISNGAISDESTPTPLLPLRRHRSPARRASGRAAHRQRLPARRRRPASDDRADAAETPARNSQGRAHHQRGSRVFPRLASRPAGGTGD